MMANQDSGPLEVRVSGKIPEPGRRLLPFLKQTLRCNEGFARNTIHAGGVWVNGKVQLRGDWLLEVGDRIQIFPWQPETSKPERLAKTEPRIIYQDDLIVVVDKPAGVLTVPTPYRERNTLIHWLEQTLSPRPRGKSSDDQQRQLRGVVFSVHRLDRDVSGLLVFARTLEIAEQMREQFSQRKPQRVYTALVAGVMEQDQGTFRSYLATDKNLNRFSVAGEDEGELAITHYRVEERWRDATMVSVELETGRRNQIRVHFAEANHPVLGETRYRRQQAEHANWRHRRIALHAYRLSFSHPGTGKLHQYLSPLPEAFETFFAAQKRRRERD